MSLNDRSDDIQADSAALKFTLRLKALERPPKPIRMLHLKARAAVPHEERQHIQPKVLADRVSRLPEYLIALLIRLLKTRRINPTSPATDGSSPILHSIFRPRVFVSNSPPRLLHERLETYGL